MARSAVAAVLVAVLACGAFAQENTCFVDAGDGLTVDMTELGAKNWGPISQDSTYSLLLKPCNTLTYDAANMPEGNGFCFDDDMACQLNNKIPSAAAGNTQTKLEYNAATNTTTIELTGGDYCPKLDKYRMVTISLKCGTTASAPKFEDEDECNYIISWTHPAGCPISGGGSSGGLSGGDVFLIIFFVGGFLYVAVGALYMYKAKEARGVEAIPNIEFWRSLPGLIKDGCVFSWSKITGLCRGSN